MSAAQWKGHCSGSSELDFSQDPEKKPGRCNDFGLPVTFPWSFKEYLFQDTVSRVVGGVVEALDRAVEMIGRKCPRVRGASRATKTGRR